MLLYINNKSFNPNNIEDLTWTLDTDGTFAIQAEMLSGKIIILKESKIPEENKKNCSYLEKQDYYFETYIEKEFKNIITDINVQIISFIKLENKVLIQQQTKHENIKKRYSM